MTLSWAERRKGLQESLSRVGAEGRAEGESPDRLLPSFYPVAEHLRMLDPDVVLIVGPRGAGKTVIARILTEQGIAEHLSRFVPAIRFPAGATTWLSGYTLGRQGFDATGLREFLRDASQSFERARALWFVYLVRVLAPHLDDEARKDLSGFLDQQGGDIEANYTAFQRAGSRPLLALDRLDERLEAAGDFVFVSYDELDTLGAGDWDLVRAGIRGLVAFWAAYSRRWRQIRAKIFLRSDLYERHATEGGADLAKLAASRVELAWNDRDLYAMLLKRLANSNVDLFDYCRRANPKLKWNEDADLGQIPQISSWQDARPLVERMVGKHMGANAKKGLVFRWLLDHIRDGHGRALPRPFVQLVEEGARLELTASANLREPHLLTPTSLRRALDKVSEKHVVYANDEWPWLPTVKAALQGQLVPWEGERELIRQLTDLPAKEKPEASPPFEGRELLEYLIEIGVLRRRAEKGRIDVPDIFLSGLGLKRKGGVRRT